MGAPLTIFELLENLKEISDKLKKKDLSFNEYKANGGKHTRKSFSDKFGSWSNAKDSLLGDHAEFLKMKFGRLTPVKIIGKKNGYFEWLCKCDCGKTIAVRSGNLISGNTKSCGCLQGESIHKPWIKSQEKYKELTIDGVREPDFVNRKKLSTNTSGYTGVYKKSNKWVAELIVKGKKHRMYGFDTPEEAYYNGRLKLEEEHLPPEIFKKRHKK